MRTRSSRFFVILVHLLGVSNHHLPSWYYDLLTSTDSSDRASFYSGIRGVHPHSMELERLDLKEVGGLDGVDWLYPQPDLFELDGSNTRSSDSNELPDTQARHATATTAVREPFWLQDTEDGKCLGPSGVFSECGDATLWFILRRDNHKKSLRMGPFGVEEILEPVNAHEPFRYALQIVDNDHGQQPEPSFFPSYKSPSLFDWKKRRERRKQRDCLVPSKDSLNNARKHSLGDSALTSLELGPCVQHKTAWSWRVDPEGLMYLPRESINSNDRVCMQRTESSSAVLSSCQNIAGAAHNIKPSPQQHRLVHFSLVRYHATSSHTSTKPPGQATSAARSVASEKGATGDFEGPATSSSNESVGLEGLPSSKDKAHSHAKGRVGPSPLFEMNLAGRPLLSAIPTREARKESNQSPFAALKDTNPILFLGVEKRQPRQAEKEAHKGIQIESITLGKSAAVGLSLPSPGKLRKIEMNPYIAASKDEVWADPQTGLEYYTDLCEYLGHDRKEYGRHTLVGVGLFTKTMLKIKVYGIAFYVSKRDVLADPSFQEYAGLSAEELRNRPDFYEKLRTMPPRGSDPSKGGFFDRTLYLKTNMQLSTETMRSSLDSDWKKLTDEDKALLIKTSMEPRPADERMLEEIKKKDNPSRCSCAQVAPDEYEADGSCCARGIELVFTWRKNGDLEVRLNGRLMDSFPRPELGAAIFFEYLRTDDPFSHDFIERVVDGFPHLLAPLAQVHGITSSVMQQPTSPPRPAGDGHGMLKGLSSLVETVSGHAAGAAGAVQQAMLQGAADATSSAVQAAQSAGDALRHFSEEAERKRIAAWGGIVAFSKQNPAEAMAQLAAKSNEISTEVISDLAAKIKESPADFVSHVAARFKRFRQSDDEQTSEEVFPIAEERAIAPHGRVFRPTTSRWFGETLEATDEIAPIKHPTMNKTILSLVHMYLLLILIVSFPATNTSRLVRRGNKLMSASSSETSFVEYGESSKLAPANPRKGTERTSLKNAYRTGKLSAPNPILFLEGDARQGHETKERHQRIHIELNNSFAGKENGTMKKGCKPSDDKMQKSLSYFL